MPIDANDDDDLGATLAMRAVRGRPASPPPATPEPPVDEESATTPIAVPRIADPIATPEPTAVPEPATSSDMATAPSLRAIVPEPPPVAPTQSKWRTISPLPANEPPVTSSSAAPIAPPPWLRSYLTTEPEAPIAPETITNPAQPEEVASPPYDHASAAAPEPPSYADTTPIPPPAEQDAPIFVATPVIIPATPEVRDLGIWQYCELQLVAGIHDEQKTLTHYPFFCEVKVNYFTPTNVITEQNSEETDDQGRPKYLWGKLIGLLGMIGWEMVFEDHGSVQDHKLVQLRAYFKRYVSPTTAVNDLDILHFLA